MLSETPEFLSLGGWGNIGMLNRRQKRVGSNGFRWPRLSLIDMLWGTAATPLAFYLRDPDRMLAAFQPDMLTYCIFGGLFAVAMLMMFQIGSGMTRYFSADDAFDVIKAAVATAAFSMLAMFLISRLETAPRSLPVLHALILAAGWLVGRGLARVLEGRRIASRQTSTGEPVEHLLIIGATRLAWFFVRLIADTAPGRHQVVGILDTKNRLIGRALGGIPVVGVPSNLSRLVQEYKIHGIEIDRIVVAVPRSALSAEVTAQLETLVQQGRSIMHLEQQLTIGESAAKPAVTFSDGANLETERSLIERRRVWRVKRVMDITVALLAAIAILPALPVIALLTALDVGMPILFWQQRVGRKGRGVFIYKFRTLRTLHDGRGAALTDDQRLSGFGRFARTCRLDELPQLWSVIIGDMSLIGPRPLLPVDQPDEVGLRLMISPGITGWAQINGGKLLTIAEKDALDEWYVRHASVPLDIEIAFRTLHMLLYGDRRSEARIAEALAEARRDPTSGADDDSAGPSLSAPAPPSAEIKQFPKSGRVPREQSFYDPRQIVLRFRK